MFKTSIGGFLCLLLLSLMTACATGDISASQYRAINLTNKESANMLQREVAGYRIISTRSEDGNGDILLNSKIILEDQANRIWIGDGRGVCLYNESQNTCLRFNKQALKLWASDVEHLGQSSDNRIWASTVSLINPNLSFFDGERWYSASKFNRSPVSAIFPGHGGAIWFAMRDSLLSYNNGVWSKPYDISNVLGFEQEFNIIGGLQDSNGDIWLGIQGYIVKLNKEVTEPRTYSVPLVTPSIIYEDKDRKIWFVSLNGQGAVYSKEKDMMNNFDLKNKVFQDQQVKDVGYNDRAMFGVKSMIQGKAGQIMFATSKGLLTFTLSENKWQLFTKSNSGLPDNYISTIFEDRTGRVWLGTGAGIVVLEP